MNNTQKTIDVIIEKLINNAPRNYAVLKPQADYEDVDWQMVAIFFNTNEINAYNQGDKIVVEV